MKQTKAKNIAPQQTAMKQQQTKPATGAGAGGHTPMLRFLEKYLLKHLCRCESQEQCVHYASLWTSAYERMRMIVDARDEQFAEFPAELKALVRSYRANNSAHEKTLKSIKENLPKKKRNMLMSRLELYESDFRSDETMLLIGIAFVKGVFDYEWGLAEKLEAIEKTLQQLRWSHPREVYHRQYLTGSYEVEQLLKENAEKEAS